MPPPRRKPAVVGEVVDWTRHSEEQLRQMKEGLVQLTAEGLNRIID